MLVGQATAKSIRLNLQCGNAGGQLALGTAECHWAAATRRRGLSPGPGWARSASGVSGRVAKGPASPTRGAAGPVRVTGARAAAELATGSQGDQHWQAERQWQQLGSEVRHCDLAPACHWQWGSRCTRCSARACRLMRPCQQCRWRSRVLGKILGGSLAWAMAEARRRLAPLARGSGKTMLLMLSDWVSLGGVATVSVRCPSVRARPSSFPGRLRFRRSRSL